jgi:hypothetical protein
MRVYRREYINSDGFLAEIAGQTYTFAGLVKRYLQICNSADFEAKHPRKPNGEFGKGGREKPKTLHTKMGKAFRGVKGQAAIEKLLKEKTGHVPNAFTHKDLGGITLMWGDEKQGGLSHIIKRREEQGISARDFLTNLSDVIETGAMSFNKKSGRFEILKDKKVAVVDFIKEGEEAKFLLTAFRTRKKP